MARSFKPTAIKKTIKNKIYCRSALTNGKEAIQKSDFRHIINNARNISSKLWRIVAIHMLKFPQQPHVSDYFYQAPIYIHQLNNIFPIKHFSFIFALQ